MRRISNIYIYIFFLNRKQHGLPKKGMPSFIGDSSSQGPGVTAPSTSIMNLVPAEQVYILVVPIIQML